MADMVEIRDLRKSYGTVEVLKGINLSFRRGEIHAFLGANGAGKSTLLGCLSGATAPTSGTIRIDGADHAALTPRQARDLGIGIIYQHFQVIEGLTVADNIFLGSEITRFGVVDTREQNRVSREYLSRLRLDIDPATPLERLSIGERQLVEIARALHQQPVMLILDEPTAALSTREMLALHDVVRQLAHQENLAIVYVTHLIEEIEQIADCVSILRDGQVIWTRPVGETDHDMIAGAIAPFLARSDAAAPVAADAPEVLALTDYRSGFSGPINLSVRAGEVVGLYGLLGAGRTDLIESLIGARRRMGGGMALNGRAIHPADPRAALAEGIALVAADRPEQGLFGELSALDNLLMPHFGKIAGSTGQQYRIFAEIAQRVHLHPNNPDLDGIRFSGGNAQKLMIGRWLIPGAKVHLLLLDEPTQGVDIGAREELYSLLRAFTEAGGAILVSSSDPEELVTLAHRVLIMAKGRQSALIDRDITEENLVRLAHQTAARAGANEIAAA